MLDWLDVRRQKSDARCCCWCPQLSLQWRCFGRTTRDWGQRTTVKDKSEEISKKIWTERRQEIRTGMKWTVPRWSQTASPRYFAANIGKCLIQGRSGSQQASCLQSRLSSAPFFANRSRMIMECYVVIYTSKQWNSRITCTELLHQSV